MEFDSTNQIKVITYGLEFDASQECLFKKGLPEGTHFGVIIFRLLFLFSVFFLYTNCLIKYITIYIRLQYTSSDSLVDLRQICLVREAIRYQIACFL